MTEIVKFNNVEDYIIEIRGQKVILDRDVAALYEVETKRVNEAVKNNADKFPDGYVIELTSDELLSLRSKFSTLKKAGRGEHTKYIPKAFTEKGLYMLATILKSPKATQTAISIIETFSKLHELSRTIGELTVSQDKSARKSLMQKSSEIISDLLSEDMCTNETETEIELNLALLKLKHTIKRKERK